MNANALELIIRSVGLEEHEAKLYIAGLKLGAGPASAYAKATKFNRVTTYNHLEDLVKRGIFSRIKKAKGKWYEPISPESLSVEARKNVDSLERALPDLKAMMGKHHRSPRVRYFEGAEGIKKVYEDTLTAEGELLNFANSEIVREFWKEYDLEYVKKRVKKGIYLKGIAPDDKIGRKVHGQDKKNLREIRLVSVKDFPITNEINIYDNKVAIVSFSKEESELFGVIIESREVAETQKQIFTMAWRYAGLGESNRAPTKATKKNKEPADPNVRKDQLIMF